MRNRRIDARPRPPRTPRRGGERVALHARIEITTLDGKPVAPLARCTNIGLGGLRVSAAEGPSTGTRICLELRLPSGRAFRSEGRIAWSKTTLHPPLLGTPIGRDDDASFGIRFDNQSAQDLLPIARLLVARDDERRRARRIRRLHSLGIHA